MKKLIAAFFAVGMFAAVLGAAETQVYNANFKKDSVAWSPKKEVIKVQKNTALIVDVIGHAQSIQIGTQVPAGLEAGNYRMDCTITLSQAAKTRVYISKSPNDRRPSAGVIREFLIASLNCRNPVIEYKCGAE